MAKINIPGTEEFLVKYPLMVIKPSDSLSSITLGGTFNFDAKWSNQEINDSYELQINIPLKFPKELPNVIETGKRIPRDGKHHVNPNGDLCYGTPLRMLKILSEEPTLCGFAEKCLIPYLYSMSIKLKYGGDLPFGEVGHGKPGALNDYADLFGLKTSEQAQNALKLLSMKKRGANKKQCPCGCGNRLGKCVFHNKINEYRNLADRKWFESQL